MRSLKLALWFMLTTTAAVAQTYPSPTFSGVNVTTGGTYKINSIPLLGLSGTSAVLPSLTMGNLIGTSSAPTLLLAGQYLTTYLGADLGAIYGQRVDAWTGGAANDASAPANAAVRGYTQVANTVTYANELGGLFVTDNYSWLAQGSGVFAQGISYHGGRVWGVLGEAKEYPETYTATAGQTTFTVPNNYSQNTEHVLKNGVSQVLGSTYTQGGCSGGLCSTVILSSGAAAGDTITVYRGASQQGLIATELDVYGNPGVDNLNPYTGNRIGLQVLGQRNDSGTLISDPTHIGSLINIGTATGVTADRGISFSGTGGTYNGTNGIDFNNTQLSGNAIYIPGALSNGGNIGIGSTSRDFPLEVAGTTTTMSNGVQTRWRDTTSGTIDVRCGASGAFGIGACGSYSAHDFALWAQGSLAIRMTSTMAQLSRGLQLNKVAYASLPTCNGTNEGAVYAVTDSNSATFNAVMAGGGANRVMAYCNGTNWTVH